MKIADILGVSLLLIACNIFCCPVSGREILNFNTDWAFHRGDHPEGASLLISDADWIPAVIPHVMQLEKKHCGGDIIYDGVGWYRRSFTVAPETEGKRVAIHFEGVMTNCSVFLNGDSIASHHGGYLGFTVDITDRVKRGEPNLLAVRVDASHDPLTPPGKPQADMDFYYYSGIYRDVSLVVTDPVFVTDPLQEDVEAGGGVFVSYPEVNEERALVKVDTHLRSLLGKRENIAVLTTLTDADGNVVTSDTCRLAVKAGGTAALSQTLTVERPRLWHPQDPYLYRITTEIVAGDRVADIVSTAAGIRTISFDIRNGFSINGRPLYLRGANRHQAYPYIGDAAPNSMQEREAKAMRESGFNAVRAAHYPHDPAFLDACDRYGLLVVECIPGWQYFNADPVFAERVCEAVRQMIRRDRNHPSIIVWETMLNETRYPVGLADSLYRIAHREYPGNQMYTSGDYFGHEEMAPYFDVLYKQVCAFPSDGNVLTNIPENLIAVRPLLTREWGDGVGDKPRASLSEPYDQLLRQCYSRLGQLEGDGYFDWCMLDANPFMAGHFLWSYNDYARGSQDETMYSGAVDMTRYPKPSLFMLKSMLSPGESSPMVYIASDNTADTCVTVFSNADRVCLYRNGKPAGTVTRADASAAYPNITSKGGSPIFRFNLGDYEAGELKAVAFISDEPVAEHRISTPGSASRLKIVVGTDGIEPVADGCDLIPIYVIVCDDEGNRISHFESNVTLAVDGDAALVGDGIDRLGINPQMPDGGVAFYFVRTGKQAGELRLTASADGVAGDEAVVAVSEYRGKYVGLAEHEPYGGNEEDGVVVKESTWQQRMLRKKPLAVAEVAGNGSDLGAVIDGDDNTWWIAPSDSLPQSITVDLGGDRWVEACRIRFQKDSSFYRHTVETSTDGTHWTPLVERECSGWDFKPFPVNREMRYLRLTVGKVSEGRAGVTEITFY